jgi:hypothetical protein
MRQRFIVPRERAAWKGLMALLCAAVAMGFFVASTGGSAGAAPKLTTSKFGLLDCNGRSKLDRIAKLSMICTDIRGLPGVHNANNWNDRFFDNGLYIGHDEPDLSFLSSVPGSGNNVTWTDTLGTDPKALPTVKKPGSDVVHWFELSPAPWYSMVVCDSNSYPQIPCTPESDNNAPQCQTVTGCSPTAYPGSGMAFMEMQFYPPGMAPFVDSASCDNTHWCAAMTIDSLECTLGFAQCNNGCTEPVNFAFIQRNGVPAGPPSPQLADLATFTPNSETLLMNPGDKIQVHMWDAPVPKSTGKALEIMINDLTTKQSGYIQASGANGFQNTSIVSCGGTPYNFQPAYNTASRQNVAGWSALQTNIGTEFETGHFEPCTSLKGAQLINAAGTPDRAWFECIGPYEKSSDSGSQEVSDGLCYYKGDTHFFLNSAPDEVTGCQDNATQNGDLDFDGTPYYPDWPSSTTAGLFPGSFVFQNPTSGGKSYTSFYQQTDVALSESNCGPSTPSACTVPPKGPGNFYPYWSQVDNHGICTWEFGNVGTGTGVNTFGRDKQYGTVGFKTVGFAEFIGPILTNACPAK